MTTRTKRIEFRCTPEEKAVLERAAKDAGVETGTWVRVIAVRAAKNYSGFLADLAPAPAAGPRARSDRKGWVKAAPSVEGCPVCASYAARRAARDRAR